MKGKILVIDIPHICPFWYASTLFGFVKKYTKKCVNSQKKISKTGQNYAFSMLTSTKTRKSTPLPVVWLRLI